MPKDDGDRLSILIAKGSSITAYCDGDKGCRRTLDLDIYDLVMMFGLSARYINATFPIRCSACGNRQIRYILGGETAASSKAPLPGNFRSSRPLPERAALAKIFPREDRPHQPLQPHRTAIAREPCDTPNGRGSEYKPFG